VGIGGQLALVGVLVLLNAAFAGSEIALISLREGQVKRLEGRGGAGAVLARLARDPNRFLATIQIGITLAGFLASATAAVTLAQPLVEPLAFLGGLARPAAILLVTAVLTYVTLVVGELAPKRLAMQRAEAWALVAARPLAAIAAIARPAVWFLGWSTDIVVRLLGGDPGRRREDVTEEELRDLLATQRWLTTMQREILSGAFEAAERSIRYVLTPRRRVVSLPRDTPAGEAIDLLLASGFSRAPVVDGDLDDVVGVVHLRELIRHDGAVGDVADTPLALPETVTVLEALRRMQAERQHLAIVVSEHGGTDGIVTIEDLVEEVVGEIYDESDRDVRGAVRLPEGGVVVAGSFPLHDLVDIGVELPADIDYTTVAGLILQELQRIPVVGDEVGVTGWTLRVLEVEQRAVARVRIEPVAPDEVEDSDGDG
jgi:putative hemolysin